MYINDWVLLDVYCSCVVRVLNYGRIWKYRIIRINQISAMKIVDIFTQLSSFVTFIIIFVFIIFLWSPYFHIYTTSLFFLSLSFCWV